MLGKFAPNYVQAVQVIQAALDSEDWELAKRSAHTLKGAAATIGASVLSGFAAQLETVIAARETGKYSLLIARIDIELSRVIALIDAYLKVNAVEPDRAQ